MGSNHYFRFSNISTIIKDYKNIGDYLLQFSVLNTISSLSGHPLRDRKIGNKFRGELLREIRKTLEWDQKNIDQGLYPSKIKKYKSLKNKTIGFFNILLDYPAVIKNRKTNKTVIAEKKDEEFPNYFKRNFHFQTDGYLSKNSASLYDQQVDILFSGLADNMRRCFLPFLTEYFKNTQKNLSILEMAAGTGAGTEQLITLFPDAEITLNDLSPYYLEISKEKFRNYNFNYLTGEAHHLSNLQPDSFDLSFHIFLFHEIPREVRKKVLQEQIRLAKKDGLIVIVDSLQISDRPEWKEILEDFPKKYHEPFYKDYINQDLDSLLEELNLEVLHKEKVLLTKCIITKKK